MHYSLGQIIEKHRTLSDRMRGCTVSVVTDLETAFGMPLPNTYKDFLLKMGCSRGLEKFMQFSFIPELLGINDDAREALIEDEAPFRLASNAFVFSSRQSYSFLFFYCGEDDDPAVHRLVSGDDSAVSLSSSFSQYLFDYLSGLFIDPKTS